MDFSLARTNMVKSQVAPNGVSDAPILAALMETQREAFVDAAHKPFSYSDHALPLGATRRCLKPLQMARLIQALDVTPGQTILVAGAGTGYEASLLAHLGAHVFALEADATLAEQGQQLTQAASVQWQTGDPRLGWADKISFDGILLCGSVASIPDPLLNQVSDQGVLVAIVGTEESGKAGGTIMHATRIRGRNGQQAETLFETFAFPLFVESEPQRFVL